MSSEDESDDGLQDSQPSLTHKEWIYLIKFLKSRNPLKANKIPEYARDYKNEYLFIRGINKSMEDFLIKYNLDASELFVSSYSDRIKLYIRKFLKAQELGYLKDTSCFIIEECDVHNIIDLFFYMDNDFDKDKKLREDGFGDKYSVDLPGYRDFYELFCKFYDKINIDFSESDSFTKYKIFQTKNK